METTKCQLSGENLSHFTLVFLDTLSCRPPFQTELLSRLRRLKIRLTIDLSTPPQLFSNGPEPFFLIILKWYNSFTSYIQIRVRTFTATYLKVSELDKCTLWPQLEVYGKIFCKICLLIDDERYIVQKAKGKTVLATRTISVFGVWTDRPITCFSYVLMISLDHQNKMADYLINWPFCSDDFIRSYKIIRSQNCR